MLYPKTQQYIDALLAEKIFPGVSYAFISGGKVEQQVKGLAAVVPEPEQLRENMLYDVASLTKVMGTTTVLLKLWEAGRINFDDKVQKYLPDFRYSEITLRHLLTHTSGLNPFIPNRDGLNAAELKAAMLQLGRTGGFEKAAVYTDVGFILLGFVIESIFQKPVQQVIQTEVLEPLKMISATFHPTNAKNCVPTENHATRGLIRGVVHDPKAFVLGENCGSAGLFASLADCLIFAEMMLNDGKTKMGEIFLQPATISMLAKDQSPKQFAFRSLGWNLLEGKSQPILFHTGFTGTFMCLDVVNKEAFIFLSNRIHPVSPNDDYLEVRRKLIDIYLTEIK